MQRSASTHRSLNSRPMMISSGIALSAPAILCRHEYIETLMKKEKPASRSTEVRSQSATRIEKTSKRTSTSKRTKFKSDKIRSSFRKEHVAYSAPDLTMRNSRVNLPEFIQFESDHLVLTPKLTSLPYTERLRTSGNFQTNKSNRQSLTLQTAPVIPTSNPSNLSSSSKRSSRSRNSHDPIVRYDKQQSSRHSPRTTLTNFDSMACFQEVSQLVLFESFCRKK